MRSEARAELARMAKAQGTSGVLKVDAPKGYELPPGSMRYPPCQCPQCRAAQARETTGDVLGAKVREANERSAGEQPASRATPDPS